MMYARIEPQENSANMKQYSRFRMIDTMDCDIVGGRTSINNIALAQVCAVSYLIWSIIIPQTEHSVWGFLLSLYRITFEFQDLPSSA